MMCGRLVPFVPLFWSASLLFKMAAACVASSVYASIGTSNQTVSLTVTLRLNGLMLLHLLNESVFDNDTHVVAMRLRILWHLNHIVSIFHIRTKGSGLIDTHLHTGLHCLT